MDRRSFIARIAAAVMAIPLAGLVGSKSLPKASDDFLRVGDGRFRGGRWCRRHFIDEEGRSVLRTVVTIDYRSHEDPKVIEALALSMATMTPNGFRVVGCQMVTEVYRRSVKCEAFHWAEA